jgi:hypothetical protein
MDSPEHEDEVDHLQHHDERDKHKSICLPACLLAHEGGCANHRRHSFQRFFSLSRDRAVTVDVCESRAFFCVLGAQLHGLRGCGGGVCGAPICRDCWDYGRWLDWGRPG